jgi:ribonuclease HI
VCILFFVHRPRFPLFRTQSIARDRDYLGYNVTNNQAEYQGLINGLDYMVRQGMSCGTLYVRGDSQLVIRQMEGRFRVKSDNLKPYHNEANESVDQVDCSRITYKLIARERNGEADGLANQAIQNA